MLVLEEQRSQEGFGVKDVLFGRFFLDGVGRGRDDSETPGRWVPGPDGGRDWACGPRARYVTYV